MRGAKCLAYFLRSKKSCMPQSLTGTKLPLLSDRLAPLGVMGPNWGPFQILWYHIVVMIEGFQGSPRQCQKCQSLKRLYVWSLKFFQSGNNLYLWMDKEFFHKSFLSVRWSWKQTNGAKSPACIFMNGFTKCFTSVVEGKHWSKKLVSSK